MLLTTDYLFKLQEQSFRLTHKKCIEYFTRRLRDKEIEFSEPIFNQVFDKSILRFRVPSGSNLSSRTTNENMYKMTIRKIAKYKEDDWKRQNNIISLRKLVDKNKYNEFLNKFEVSVFDFPYYMRIRANYRDFAFIEGVNTSDTANYFNKYFTFAINLVKAIEYLNRKIARQRQLSF